jgi:hypothetical protein
MQRVTFEYQQTEHLARLRKAAEAQWHHDNAEQLKHLKPVWKRWIRPR